MNQELIAQSSKKFEVILPENEDVDRLLIYMDLERAEVSKEQPPINDCLIGHIEGRNALHDFKDCRNYLDNRDTLFLLNMDKFGFNKTDKNYFLMQIHDRVVDRAKKDILPKNTPDYESFAELKDYLKTNYIMSLNNVIETFIESTSKENNNFDNLSEYLTSNLLIASASPNRYYSGLKNIDTNFGTRSKQEAINDAIEGMRHEVAFEQLICEMPEDIIDFNHTDDERDSRGADFILKTKISKQKPNGKYKYATKSEIAASQYDEMYLPLDIKASSESATMELSRLHQYADRKGGPLDHWVMWSHIYPQDFKLHMDDGRPVVDKDNEPEAIFLKYDEQIAAMRDLSGIRYREHYKRRSKFNDAFRYNESFIPYSLDERLDDIKRQVLQGINELYSSESEVMASRAM